MSDFGPSGFSVSVHPSGRLVLRGELDTATVPVLEEKIAEVMSPGRSVVLDMTALTFMDSSGIHCLIKTWKASGEPVTLQNPSDSIRRVLGLTNGRREPEAWVIEHAER
jgi:anti-anti-sigma factor